MRSKGYFTSQLTKSYDYFLLPDGTADVFIYDLNSVEEVTQKTEENEFVQFRYNMKKTELEMIAEVKEENNMLKECLLEMSELVYQ